MKTTEPFKQEERERAVTEAVQTIICAVSIMESLFCVMQYNIHALYIP
jgi:hypothetical protein